MVDTGRSEAIAMVDFKLGQGRVTVFADMNPFDVERQEVNRPFFLNLANDSKERTTQVLRAGH
jgi:hypothetical protein